METPDLCQKYYLEGTQDVYDLARRIDYLLDRFDMLYVYDHRDKDSFLYGTGAGIIEQFIDEKIRQQDNPEIKSCYLHFIDRSEVYASSGQVGIEEASVKTKRIRVSLDNGKIEEK